MGSTVNVLFDAVIVGSSFSGCILGQILAKSGWRIAIVDRATHPRFAIGESSTPTADFLLAYLADRWQIPALRPLAAWGTWQDTCPEIACGKKRGFTYYAHRQGRAFHDCDQHSQSLMVAASQSDYWSDTHWLRSDVDSFLASQSTASGCELRENTDIVSLHRDDETWRLEIVDRNHGSDRVRMRARWIIDAGGGGDFSERWLGNQRDDDWMKTQTASVFGHFRGVESFVPQIHPFPSAEIDPQAGFHPDDSAQHHVTDNGWTWMLRFNQGVTSVGIVQPTQHWKPIGSIAEATVAWTQWIQRYPSIQAMLERSTSTVPNEPIQTTEPIQPKGAWLRWSNRLSRCRSRAVGDGWLQLPTAYGFVDPLHSTGIAHALSGVARVAEQLIADGSVDASTSARWVSYDRQLRQEIEWIDLVVGGCYRSLPSFATFCAFASWYFVAAIQFERVMSRDPSRWPDGYLSCENDSLRRNAEVSYALLGRQSESASIESIRRGIAPWNDVGLLEPMRGQRIPHTAPPKYAEALL